MKAKMVIAYLIVSVFLWVSLTLIHGASELGLFQTTGSARSTAAITGQTFYLPYLITYLLSGQPTPTQSPTVHLRLFLWLQLSFEYSHIK